MPTSREVLESTYRVGRIKKVRRFVFSAMLVLTIVLLLVVMLIMGDSDFYIFGLPLEWLVFVVAFMLLVVNIESFFFRIFGIRFAKTDSEKFLMVKDYIRRAIVLIVGAILIISFVNFFAPTTDENIDVSRNIVVDGEFNTTFWSQDVFGIMGIIRITVVSENSVPMDIFILQKQDYISGLIGKRVNFDESKSRDLTALEYKPDGFLEPGDYVLYMDAKGEVANVTYSLERGISQNLVLYLTLFPGIFAGINVAWIVYLHPLKKRYEKTSIYE